MLDIETTLSGVVGACFDDTGRPLFTFASCLHDNVELVVLEASSRV